MKIEEAIKQESFSNEKEKVVVNILYTSSWITYQQHGIFKLKDLSMQQYNVLRILKGQYPNSATVNLLIDRMLDKSSNASRIVEKLRAKGLVNRKSCSNDRRRVDVIITSKGLEVLEDTTKEMQGQAWNQNNISAKEAQELNRLLDKLRTNEKSNTQ